MNRTNVTRTRRRRAALLMMVLSSFAVVAPIWFWRGGLIEIEATLFVEQYLDDRGVLQKVFDPYRNDMGTYQARELSYFFDYLDAHVFDALIRGGYVVLVPATSILASVSTVIILVVAATKIPTMPLITAALLVLLYLTNYVHLVTMGMLYRSGKPLLAPLVLATTLYVVHVVRRKDIKNASRAASLVFLLLCGMGLLDRQGFFLATIAATVLVLNVVLRRGQRGIAVSAVAAVSAMTAYNLSFAPWIVERLNGYRPSLDYQRIPVNVLLTDTTPWVRAGQLLLEAASLLLGGTPVWLLAAGSVVLVAWRGRGLFQVSARLAVLWAGVAAGVLVMYAGMVVRHPPIYEYVDHRLWYYPLPFQALLLACGLTGLAPLATRGWTAGRAATVNSLLALAIAANVASWNSRLQMQLASEWFPWVYEQSDALRASLADGRPRPPLAGEYFEFYEFCLARSAALRGMAAGSPSAR